MYGLARNFVGSTHNRRFSDARVEDESGLDLSGGQAMSRHFDDIYISKVESDPKREQTGFTIYSAFDPNVSVLVADSTVSSVEITRIRL